MEGSPRQKIETSSSQERFPDPTIRLERVSTPAEFIQAIDFNTLNDIFDSLSDKSRNAEPSNQSRHRIRPEKVLIAHSSGEGWEKKVVGKADVETGGIELLWPGGDRNAIILLRNLMHEATHVRGGYKAEITKTSSVDSFVIRKGLHEQTYEHEKISGSAKYEVTGLSLSEAITEEIANEVFREYLARTGEGAYASELSSVEASSLGGYMFDRFVLRYLVEVLADRLEVSRDDVWKGVVHAYINGNQSISERLSELETEISSVPSLRELLFLGADSQLAMKSGAKELIYGALEQSDLAVKALEGVTEALDLRQVHGRPNHLI